MPLQTRDPATVREMFSAISPRYDFLNHLLSGGMDRSWRRQAVQILAPAPGDLVLDLCGGTGDLALEAAGRGARIICCDFSGPMLARAARKFRCGQQVTSAGRSNGREPAGARGPLCLLADALRLPFADGSFHGVAIAFGLRNLRSLGEGLDETLRVLRPGGRACILEFSRPASGPLVGLYNLYLNRILPRVGDLISRRQGPYGYLARTIGEFPGPAELASCMAERGFSNVLWRSLTGGIVAVHSGRRPE